jgi:hypothetical protein
MLCCESGSVDQESGLISHYRVLDRILLQRKAVPKPKDAGVYAVPVEILRFSVVAVWERDKGDSDDTEFEVEVAFKRPEKKLEDVIHKATFKFTRLRQRFTVQVRFIPPPEPQNGMFYTECRIRRIGAKAWIRQSYQIVQEVTEAEPPANVNGKKRRRRK